MDSQMNSFCPCCLQGPSYILASRGTKTQSSSLCTALREAGATEGAGHIEKEWTDTGCSGNKYVCLTWILTWKDCSQCSPVQWLRFMFKRDARIKL
jgi:hypothetical protein